jgi:hypothetical protein
MFLYLRLGVWPVASGFIACKGSHWRNVDIIIFAYSSFNTYIGQFGSDCSTSLGRDIIHVKSGQS